MDVITLPLQLEQSGYLFIFFLMIIEGPVVTMLSSFGASFGYFNIWIIMLLAFLGDVVGDLLHYSGGRIIRKTVIERYATKRKVRKENIKTIEKKIHANLFGTIFLAKIASPLAGLTLILTGTTKVPLGRFVKTSVSATIPLTLTYTALGYFFGVVIKEIIPYIKIGQWIIAIIIITLIGIVILYKTILPKIIRTIHA